MTDDTIQKTAFGFALAQAGVRPMTPDEVAQYIKDLVTALQPGETLKNAPNPAAARNSIGENYVTCLECGKKFRMMGKRHLMTHGLTAKEYKAKWGLKKTTALAAKSLARMRRKKMRETRLWEHRSAATAAQQ